MDIVNNLNEHFRIDAYKAAALKEDIESLDSFSNIAIPDDYKDFVRKMTEAEILLDNGAYVRIWGPLGCIEETGSVLLSLHFLFTELRLAFGQTTVYRVCRSFVSLTG